MGLFSSWDRRNTSSSTPARFQSVTPSRRSHASCVAHSAARPAPEATQRLLEAYGPEKAEAIHLALRMIRMGNLLGNSGDAVLYYLSFGRLGAPNLTPSPLP